MITNFKKEEIIIYTFFNQWWIKIYAELDIRIGLNRIEKYLKSVANTFSFYPHQEPCIIFCKKIMVMLRISLISDHHHHHHHHCHHLWHWSLSCLAYGSDKYNFKWCNIVRFCLCIIIIIIIISFIYVRPTYSRSCIWNTRYRCMWKKSDWWTQPRWEKKPFYPFSVLHVMTLSFFFLLYKPSLRPFLHSVLRTWVM